MTTLSQLPTSDLVLRVTGGPRSGELIPVSTPKCYLGMESTNEAISKNPQCVIFRGREGAVIRSYADQVTLNDAAASLHWLQEGDAIRFPNQMKIEVVQLGELKDIASFTSRNSKNSVLAENNLEESLVVLESELRSIQVQNEQSQTQLDQLDSRLNTLTEQMTMLINLSSNGTGVQVSQTSQLIAAPVASPQTTTTEATAGEATAEATTTEDIATTPQSPETESAALTEQRSSTEQPSVENTKTDEPAEETTSAIAPQEEVIQSPVATSPLEELDRIDKAIEDSVSGYYSHTDDSDEQILTFEGDSAASAEPTSTEPESVNSAIEASNVVTEEEIISPLSASAALEPSTEPTDSDNGNGEEAAALAETEQRLSEMERIFGGALSDSEPDQETTLETTDSVESTQTESTETIQPVDTIQPADEQLAKTFEDLAHGQNAEVDSSADNPTTTDSAESIVSEQLQESASNAESTDAVSAENQDLESQLSPMARQLLQDVKSEQVPEQSEAAKLPVMLPPSERVGSQTVVFPIPETGNEDQQSEATQSEAQQSTNDHAEPEAEEIESGLSTMARKLLDDVKSEQVEETQDVKLPEMVPMSERVDSETVIFPKGEGNESVADILARMKEDGKWDGISDEDDQVEPIESVATEPTEEESSLDSSSNTDEEADVDDYMSQLLSRMRGEEPAVAAKATKKKEVKKKQNKKEAKAEKPVEEVAFVKPADPLKPEEFKPKRKAEKLKSLDAMRELGNLNRQTNVKTSQNQFHKAKAIVSAIVGAMGLSMSLCYLLYSKALFDLPFLVGVVCLLLAGVCGYVFYQNITKASKAKKTLESVAKAEKDSKAEKTPESEAKTES